ncbi:hypothetical protein V9T40_001183 [Parthenolecanium corni]|uniref:Uncharacterized protein n=1 Tax=Parthenolecanium corni TaxID=536013 RepID=A0AAN9TEH4_9HEMI
MYEKNLVMFVERLILRAISLQEITTALDGDQILKDVCARLRQNLLIQEKPYSALVDELCIIKGVLPRGIDHDAEVFVSTCEECQKVGKAITMQTMSHLSFPDGPWQDLPIDFKSLPANKHLCVVVYYFSKFVECKTPTRTTSIKRHKNQIEAFERNVANSPTTIFQAAEASAPLEEIAEKQSPSVEAVRPSRVKLEPSWQKDFVMS